MALFVSQNSEAPDNMAPGRSAKSVIKNELKMDPDSQESKKRKYEADDEGIGYIDEDEEEAPYDEKQEPFPQHPAFDPRVSELKASATKQLTSFCERIAEMEQSHPDLRNMQVKAQQAQEMREPDRQMIALVGDAGAGK